MCHILLNFDFCIIFLEGNKRQREGKSYLSNESQLWFTMPTMWCAQWCLHTKPIINIYVVAAALGWDNNTVFLGGFRRKWDLVSMYPPHTLYFPLSSERVSLSYSKKKTAISRLVELESSLITTPLMFIVTNHLS